MLQSLQDNPLPVSTLYDESTKLLNGYCFLCLCKAFHVNDSVLHRRRVMLLALCAYVNKFCELYVPIVFKYLLQTDGPCLKIYAFKFFPL